MNSGIRENGGEGSDNLVDQLRRENDYMEHLLTKVKEIFKVDQEAGLVDLDVYLTQLRDDGD